MFSKNTPESVCNCVHDKKIGTLSGVMNLNLEIKSNKKDINCNNNGIVKGKTIQVRKEEVMAIRNRFPTKIPIIVQRFSKETHLPQLDKSKFLVPQEITMSQFLTIIRNRMRISSTQTLYLLVNNRSMISLSLTLSEVYTEYAGADGFLYVTYASQEVFGSNYKQKDTSINNEISQAKKRRGDTNAAMDDVKLKKWKPILELQYPERKPQDGEFDYRESKLLDMCKMTQPDWDIAQNSIEFNLIEALREFDEATEYLKKRRAEAKEQYVKNDVQWTQLKSKEESLRQSFIKFEQFVIENVDKRNRAIKKMAEEIEMQHVRADMIVDLKQQTQFIVNIKWKFEQKLKEYRIYEDYLNKVVAESQGQFRNVDTILKRYQSLMETKSKVAQKRNKEMDELDGAKVILNKIIQGKILELMALNTKMVDLVCRYDQARNNSVHWETVVAAIKERSEVKQGEISGVLSAIWKIYGQMCERRGEPLTIPMHDFEAQMSYISNGLENLKRVYNVVSKPKKRDKRKAAFK